MIRIGLWARRSILLLATCVTFIAVGNEDQTGDDSVNFSAQEIRLIQQHQLPALAPDPTNRYGNDPAAARLGQFLFFSTRFSRNKKVSCASCHRPELDFSDGFERGQGLSETLRHTPSLWNVAYQRWFFWDGRKDSLWAHALAPFEDPREFAMARTLIVAPWYREKALGQAYEAVFGPLPHLGKLSRLDRAARPRPMTPDSAEHRAWLELHDADRLAVNRVFSNLGKALAAYQRQLITPPSPFDRFVRSLTQSNRDQPSFSSSAKRGLKLFLGRGRCRLCHSGPLFSDGEFHDNGIPGPDGRALQDPARYRGVDLVRADPFNASGRWSDDPEGERALMIRTLVRSSEDWGRVKTPGLRNVARTAPYMSRGQMASLEEVLQFYSVLQPRVNRGHHDEQLLKPVHFTAEEIEDLKTFLNTLSSPALDPDLLRPIPLPR